MHTLMIASDLHGSACYGDLLLRRYAEAKPDRLMLLGDLLYHGPRNDLPRDYAPKTVIGQLNGIKDALLCVRGNCDTEVDQMVLDFPILADYALLQLGDTTVFATHGHNYGPANVPPHVPGTVLLCGHFHVPACEEHEDYVYLNPGSLAIPKADSRHSYMLWRDGVFTWHDLTSGEEYLRWPAAQNRQEDRASCPPLP